MLNGFIVNFQSVINPDQTSNVKNKLLDRYGILELFRRHGVPDLIYLNPPRVHQTQNAYNIEIVYSDEKIMAIYPGAAKLADNDKYVLCPAIGDGDVSSFSIALVNPADQKLNIIEFARGSFNKDFILSYYDDKIQLDPQGVYDLFDKQEKKCFYEDEFRAVK
jgi:hypothetical protein